MIYRRSPHLAARVIEGRTYIVDPSAGQLHELDDVASCIWKALDTPATCDDIVRAVEAVFDVPSETAAADTTVFLKELETRGLVTHEP